LRYFETSMRGRKLRPGKLKPASRYGLAIVGLMIVGGGLLKIVIGNEHGTNSRGVLAFAPFSIVIGVLLVLLAIRSSR